MADQKMRGNTPNTPSTRLYLGIDPGMSGGIALINGNKDVLNLTSLKGLNCAGIKMHMDFIRNQLTYCTLVVIMEEVGGYQGKGDNEKGGGAANGSAMFKFGAVYGRLQMALKDRDIKWKEILPNIWQKQFGDSTFSQKKGKVEHKRYLKNKAKELFPQCKGITLYTADALLLAEFIRRREELKYARV